MKIVACFLTVALSAIAQDRGTEIFRSDVTTKAKPWTHLKFFNDPNNFQFAIVSDRTGGPREGVFEDAVRKLNWLMPEFVLSVGDFIKGNSRTAATNAAEWDEFMAMIAPLKMPYFFVAGNHDIQMKWLPGRVQPEQMLAEWNARFGPTHYSFVYRNVLFVALFSNDGREAFISPEQAAYCEKVLREHAGARWTIVLLHHPLWAYPHESNFDRIERALAGRRHTVIAGHQHRYLHYERNNANYYILASTGGDSRLRGNLFGEFDHVTWVTMTDDGPVLANLRLDGILRHDVTTPASLAAIRALEESARIDASALLDGQKPSRGGSVFLTLRNASAQPLRVDGEFRHHHHVYPRPGVVTRVLPPHSRELVEVALEATQPFTPEDDLALEFAAVVSAGASAPDGLSLRAALTLPLKSSAAGVWVTEEQEFAGRAIVRPPFDRDDRDLRFTWDGSEPTRESAPLNREHLVTETTVLKARVFTRGGVAGPVDELKLVKVPGGPGLLCQYYEHDTKEGNVNTMPIFRGLAPTFTRRVANFDLQPVARRPHNFAAVYYGWLRIDEPGNHGFHVTSADGARLLIDGAVVVDDSGKHSKRDVSGFAQLARGRHAIELHFFQSNQDSHLNVDYTPPSGQRQRIPDRLLSFDAEARPALAAAASGGLEL